MAYTFAWPLCLCVDHYITDHSWPRDRNSEANISDTRKHGETSAGKLRARLEESVRNSGQ
jgi:hypothetical protein